MKELAEFPSTKIKILFTDIDDTLTLEGKLHANAYEALWKLKKADVKVVPVTGRPAGWCEMIARLWPVDGVIGENGAFYFRYVNRKMHRSFSQPESLRKENQNKLEKIKNEILIKIKNCAVASDQFSRISDLAIDFAEDVGPLPDSDIQKIVDIFTQNGAIAKVSSIHVNGWFGDFDKLSMCKEFLKAELKMTFEDSLNQIAFSGDSPNDEPMFKEFKYSFAVANIIKFKSQLKFLPRYVSNLEGGDGFVEIAEKLIKA